MCVDTHALAMTVNEKNHSAWRISLSGRVRMALPKVTSSAQDLDSEDKTGKEASVTDQLTC